MSRLTEYFSFIRIKLKDLKAQIFCLIISLILTSTLFAFIEKAYNAPTALSSIIARAGILVERQPIESIDFYFLIIWGVLFIALFGIWQKFRYPKGSYSRLYLKTFQEDWEAQGGVSITNYGSLIITSSFSGCLLRNYYWLNFKAKFQAKIPKHDKDNCLSFVFGAQDFDNYFMLQIVPDRSGHISVSPHIRISGHWEKIQNQEPINNYTYNWDFADFEVSVLNNVANVKMNNIEIFNWMIPDRAVINIISGKDTFPDAALNGTPLVFFKGKYGRVGFRQFGFEKIELKSFEIISI